eukprot:1502304-Amphidinium_carterae.1
MNYVACVALGDKRDLDRDLPHDSDTLHREDNLRTFRPLLFAVSEANGSRNAVNSLENTLAFGPLSHPWTPSAGLRRRTLKPYKALRLIRLAHHHHHHHHHHHQHHHHHH